MVYQIYMYVKTYQIVHFKYGWLVVSQFYLLGSSEVKVSACNVGDLGSIPGFGRSPGEGNGNSLQYSCLENLMDGGAWWATSHGVTKSRTRLSDFTKAVQSKNRNKRPKD